MAILAVAVLQNLRVDDGAPELCLHQHESLYARHGVVVAAIF